MKTNIINLITKSLISAAIISSLAACGSSKKSGSTSPGVDHPVDPTVTEGSCSNCTLTAEKISVLGQAPGVEMTLKILSSNNLYPNYAYDKVEASGQIVLQQARGVIPAGTYIVTSVTQPGIMNGRFIGMTGEAQFCSPNPPSLANNLKLKFSNGNQSFEAIFGVGGGCGNLFIDVGMFIMHQTRNISNGSSYKYILQGPVVLQNYNSNGVIQSIIDLN